MGKPEKDPACTVQDGYDKHFNPEKFAKFQQELARKFYGIGLTFTVDKSALDLVILEVIPDSPAEKAGFLP